MDAGRRGRPDSRGACVDLHVLERPLPAGTTAAKLARVTARVACRAWRAPQAAEDAVLLASELVTAAVRCTTAPRVVLRLLMTPRRLRIEAHDPSARLQAEDLEDDWLVVVRALSCRCGVERYGPGTQVWAEMPLPGPAQPAGALPG